MGHTITDVRSMLSAGRVEATEIVRSVISTGLVDMHRNCVSTEIAELTEQHCLIQKHFLMSE
jgi:hypothetical protein